MYSTVADPALHRTTADTGCTVDDLYDLYYLHDLDRDLFEFFLCGANYSESERDHS